MTLLDEMRVRLRVASELTDAEIEGEILAAFADMRRCGVRECMLDEESPHPLVRHAIACWVKAHYGFDNSEAERFMESYRMSLASLLNSKANEYLFGEEELWG